MRWSLFIRLWEILFFTNVSFVFNTILLLHFLLWNLHCAILWNSTIIKFLFFTQMCVLVVSAGSTCLFCVVLNDKRNGLDTCKTITSQEANHIHIYVTNPNWKSYFLWYAFTLNYMRCLFFHQLCKITITSLFPCVK